MTTALDPTCPPGTAPVDDASPGSARGDGATLSGLIREACRPPPRASLSQNALDLGAGHSARSGVRRATEVERQSPEAAQLFRPTLPPPPPLPPSRRPALPAPPVAQRPPPLPPVAPSPARGAELTMIRLSSSGRLLAARGSRSEEVANVAAFLQHTARLISADLGCTDPPSLRLEGRDESLVVLSSRQGGVCAALGATARLDALSRRAGLC